MLTKKEIESLKPGYYPNSALRKKFGKKHGSVVRERFTIKKDGKDIQKDLNIVGNRAQRRWRDNKPAVKKEKQNFFEKITGFFKGLFS